MNAIELNWNFIREQLPPGWRELAVEMGLIHPVPPQLHAKIDDIEPILRLELHRAGLEASLETTTAAAAAAKEAAERKVLGNEEPNGPLVDLAATSLHAWERKLGPYLAELLARMVDANDVFSAMRWSGYEIILADGTVVTRPGAKGTTARVLYALRLSNMTLLKCLVTDEHGSESLRVFEVRTGQLWICDRFYSNPEEIAWVVDANGDVLVRYNRGALPLYDAKGRCFDVMGHVRALKVPEAMAEWSLWVHPKGHAPIEGRLCAVRLPEEQAEKARQWLRREYGSKVTPEALEAAAWVMVFTTVSSERLTTQKILALYRFRWQVELEIKRDKSIGGLDKLPNFRDDTISTWLYAKLLIQQIARKIVSPAVAFPPSAVGRAVLPITSGGPREAAAHHAAGRRRDVARHDAGLPSDPRRTAPHLAA
jgi:DDE family transposase